MVSAAALVLAAALAVLAVLMLVNENTPQGDAFRHRPLWLRPLNLLQSALPVDFTPQQFLRGDEDEQTKLGLSVLLRALNTEAQLTPAGKVMAAVMVRDQLVHRQCVVNTRLPAATASSATPKPTVVITGLPRTGTTFLHQLLSAADTKQFRSPKFHEYMDACPRVAEKRTVAGELRIAYQDSKLALMRRMVPKLTSIHHLTATTPEEDVVPLGQVMLSPHYSTAFHVPSYQQWLVEQPSSVHVHSLVYLRHLLYKHIGGSENQSAWLLKTPWHLFHLEELVGELDPVGAVVWTHRDPVQQAASLVSTVLHLMGSNTDQLASVEVRSRIAKDAIAFWYLGLERAVQARVHHLKNNKVVFVDVRMEDLRTSPVQVAKSLYGKLGLEFDQERVERAVSDLAKKQELHTYLALKDFGVDEQHDVRDKYNAIMAPLTLNLAQ